MRITDFELFPVPPRWLLLKLVTSDGTVGWGEPIVTGRIKAVQGAVEELIESYLLNESALLVEKHWEAMYRSGFFRGGPVLMSALSGIDMALWDIRGKHYEAPVYELLGGPVRNRLCVDQWIGGDSPESLAASARTMVDSGYKVLKMKPTAEFRALESPAALKLAKERVEAVRQAITDDVGLGVSFHGRVSYPMAKQLARELEAYDPMYYEEPVLPEHPEHLADVAAHTSVPLSTGERLYSRWEFKPRFVDGAASVYHPDVAHVGGISELRKIVTMGEAHGAVFIPHCTVGPISLAASMQVGFCSQNVVIQEQSLELHDPESSTRLSFLHDPTMFKFADGYVSAPEGPGLGVTVDESAVRELSQYEVTWHHPVWHHDDGSLSEW